MKNHKKILTFPLVEVVQSEQQRPPGTRRAGKGVVNMDGLEPMPAASMVCMAVSLVISFAAPLGLALWLCRRGGKWRDFFLGAAVFFLFAMVLEQGVHSLVLGSTLGQTITGNLALYALYGGLMAGLFEETGRLLAFRLLRPGPGVPQRALMYGAGHGGMEAILLVGLTNISNLLLSWWINTGTLEQNLGGLDDSTLQAIAVAAAQPSLNYLWGGLERVVAIAIHLSLSVLVYAAFTRGRRGVPMFFAAVLLHAGVDACSIVAAAFLPIAGVELVALIWAVGLALLARRVYRSQRGNFGEMCKNT